MSMSFSLQASIDACLVAIVQYAKFVIVLKCHMAEISVVNRGVVARGQRGQRSLIFVYEMMHYGSFIDECLASPTSSPNFFY